MPSLTNDQIKMLAQISADAGQVFLALTVVPFLFGLDRTHPGVLPSGVAITLAFWIASLVLAKRGKHDD